MDLATGSTEGPFEPDQGEDAEPLGLADHVHGFGWEQHSIVTRRQLRAAGMSDDDLDRARWPPVGSSEKPLERSGRGV